MVLNPKSPIGRCSARLRRLLEIEEAMALQWKVKIIAPERNQHSSGRRWLLPASLGVPGPFSNRPVSADGKVSFHFSHETVTKGPGGVSILSSGSRRRYLAAGAAAEHEAYITRPEAVPTISAADFEEYAAGPCAVGGPDGRTAAIFSNISDDPEKRRDLWLKAHLHEREANPDRLVFKANFLKPSDWRKLASSEVLGAEVRGIAARMAEIPAGTSKVKGDAILEVDLVEGARVKKAAASIVGPWDRKRLPIRLSKGRGGRTQFRLTAEFPDGIDAAARVRITQAYCQYLAEFGVMYTAAIHAPDEHNDERNHHLHITYYDRPCALLPDGRWDFEVREKVEGQHNRYRYPFRQPKIAELARTDSEVNYRDHRASIVTRMREHFAEICNAELTKVGVQRQFDPGRYLEMGIDQEPTQPLGPRAAPLEAAGIATTVGMSNAEILWTFRLEQERKECEASRCERQKLRKRIASAASHLEPSNEKSALLKFERELAEASKVVDDHEHEIAFFRTILEMAYARPEKVSDTCSRILATLGAGKGSARDRKDRALIEARMADADGFFDQILAIQERSLGEINPIVDQVHAARKKIRALSTEVEPYLIADSSVAKKMIKHDQPISSGMNIGPEGNAQSRAKFDNLMDRILKELVVLPPTESQEHFTVRGISRDEYLMLSSAGFAPLAQSRLEKIASIQHERVAQAIRLVEEHGHQTLADLAETESNARRALLHLKVYADHPLLKRSRASVQKPIVSESRAQNGPKRGSKPIEAIPARSEKTDLIDLEGKLALEKEATNHARDLTIQDFVTFIRDNPGVIIEEHDGSLRLSRESAGDWKISADVFSEEGRVKEALADRARANLELEQREAAVANDARREEQDQRLRARIMKEIDCAGLRPVFWNGERWDVTTASADLAEIANAWQDHPDLQEAYENSDRIWAGRESLAQKKAMETVRSSSDLAAKAEGPKLTRDVEAVHAGFSPAQLEGHRTSSGGHGR